jgi:hypothetical protein
MNKMIKRQDIVPPWIEKQQELLKAAETFRARLRNDWKRHAARMIASRGGTLEEQLARAAAHARAEEIHNPRRRNPEQISVPTNSTADVVMQRVTAAPPSPLSPSNPTPANPDDARASNPGGGGAGGGSGSGGGDPPEPARPPAHDAAITQPFRDPAWEAAERPYMSLAIANLNALTRSYNLMAPELAKKPYFSLERELSSCFADVAPLVADEIRLRATRPAKSLVDAPFGGRGVGGGGGGGVGQLGAGLAGLFRAPPVKVVESREKYYGFREFWRDLWKRGG